MGSFKLKNEILDCYGDDLDEHALAYARHKEMYALVQDIARKMATPLVGPFRDFTTSYLNYYSALIQNLTTLRGTYDHLPLLFGTIDNPKDFKDVLNGCYELVKASPSLVTEREALDAATFALIEALYQQQAHLNTSSDVDRHVEKEQGKLNKLYEDLCKAECKLKEQEALCAINEQANSDHQTTKCKIQERLKAIDKSLEVHNKRLDKLVNQHKDNLHQFSVCKIGWLMTYKYDTSKSQEVQKTRINELQAERTKLLKLLSQSLEGLKRSLKGASTDALKDKVENVREQIKEQKEIITTIRDKAIHHLVASVEVGDDPKSVADSIIKCSQVRDRLDTIKSDLNHMKSSLESALKNDCCSNPRMVLGKLGIILKAPLLYHAFVQGKAEPRLMNSADFQRQFLLMQRLNGPAFDAGNSSNFTSGATVEVNEIYEDTAEISG